MSRTIPNSEYKRRVFNKALLEAIKKPYLAALGENPLRGDINEIVSTQPKPNMMPPGGGINPGPSKIPDGAKSERPSNNNIVMDTVKNYGSNAIKAAREKLKAAHNEKPIPEGASQPDLVSNGAVEGAPTKVNGDPVEPEKNKKPLLDCGPEDAAMCGDMCESYFIEELQLETSTINQTKARLANANNYIVEAADEAEEIADKRAEEAKELGVDVQDDDKIELSPEDNAVLDQLFHSKGPGPQIDQIRDATVRALVQEERKSKEVRDALDLAQSKVSTGDPNAYNETANRINQVGPTSLFGSIMNNMSRAAIRDVNESGRFTSVGDVMAENADLIKTRSVMLYAIMETGNQLEITNLSGKDVERLARNIFYQQ